MLKYSVPFYHSHWTLLNFLYFLKSLLSIVFLLNFQGYLFSLELLVTLFSSEVTLFICVFVYLFIYLIYFRISTYFTYLLVLSFHICDLWLLLVQLVVRNSHILGPSLQLLPKFFYHLINGNPFFYIACLISQNPETTFPQACLF